MQIFQVISEKKINKELNKFNTLCYKWTEVTWPSPHLVLVTEILKMGEGMVCMGTSAVRYRTSKENIVFGLGKKTSVLNSSPV